MRLKPGQVAPLFARSDIFGQPVRLEYGQRERLLLSFYRFAACPLCNLRVHRLIKAYPQLCDAGLRVVAFFQSPAQLIRENVGRQDAPFPIVADPDKEIYELYGVESSKGAMLRAFRRMPSALESLARGFWPRRIDGDPALVPADFLIDEGLVIRVAHYGTDIGDHVPLSRIRAFVDVRPPSTSREATP